MSPAPTPDGPVQRVRITSSRRWAAPGRARPIATDLDEQTGLGEVYLDGLMRAQRRLSVIVVVILAVGLGGYPLLLVAVPSAKTLSVFGLPLPWVTLGILVFPALWLLARWYTRSAERLERQFTDVLEGP